MLSHTSCLVRFYRPMERGVKMMNRGHYVYNNDQNIYMYKRNRPPDPKPFRENPVNSDFSHQQILVNPIRGIHGFISGRNNQGNKIVPKGIEYSFANFDEYMEKNFSNVECSLVLDSVMNNPTHMPMFLFPPELSKTEIKNYLQVFYHMGNIREVFVRNYSGMRYKNELGLIKKAPALKAAWVLLDEPVEISQKAESKSA